MTAFHQGGKLFEPFFRVHSVVRADIEVIFDGIRTASETLEDIGWIWRAMWVASRACLFEHPGQPDMGKTECFERRECGEIDILKLTATVLGEGAVGFAHFMGIAKGADE